MDNDVTNKSVEGATVIYVCCDLTTNSSPSIEAKMLEIIDQSDNNVVVKCDPTYGETSCIIIADGYMDFRNNTDFQGSGAAESFILLITRKADCIGDSGFGCGPGNSAIYHNNNYRFII